MNKVAKFKESIQSDHRRYEQERKAFYSNPIHWSNNKRRRYRFPVLRGSINKYRNRVFRFSVISSKTFDLAEDIIDDIVGDSFATDTYFDNFVSINNLDVGDCQMFSTTENVNTEV